MQISETRALRPTMTWPKQIPGNVRRSIAQGAGNFACPRIVTWNGAFDQQAVRISGNALIIPTVGEIELVEHCGQHHGVFPGRFALVWDTTVIMTERVIASREVQSALLFFDHRMLARAFPITPDRGRLVNLDFSCPGRVIVVDSPPTSIFYQYGEGLNNHLTALLTAAWNSYGVHVTKHFEETYFAPRRPIEAFLETLVYRPRSEHDELLDKYPGGKNALRRKMTKLGMASVATFVTHRRAVIVAKLRADEVPEKEILEKLKIKNLGRIAKRLVHIF